MTDMTDMTLLAMISGREQTLAEYDELFDQAGWARYDIVWSRSIYSPMELTPVAA